MKKAIELIDIIQPIKNATSILIIGHIRPDGDCFGAGFAVKNVCEKYGKKVDFLCDTDPLPQHYSFLPDFSSVNIKTQSEYDLVFCVDCADTMRLGRYAGYLKNRKIINIDHHITNDCFGTLNYVVPSSSSTCELVFKLLDFKGEMTKEIAFYLFCGLSTDTGHFMHNNTTSDTLETASKLLSYGLETAQITQKLYRNNTVEKTKLIARAINSMRFFADGKLCIISIMKSDLADCGCNLNDTEGLTDYGMNIGKVVVTVCLTEQDRPLYKVSFRSKGSIDVAAAAAVFGGGGHKQAAGCNISGHYEDVIVKIVKSVTDGMD